MNQNEAKKHGGTATDPERAKKKHGGIKNLFKNEKNNKRLIVNNNKAEQEASKA